MTKETSKEVAEKAEDALEELKAIKGILDSIYLGDVTLNNLYTLTSEASYRVDDVFDWINDAASALAQREGDDEND